MNATDQMDFTPKDLDTIALESIVDEFLKEITTKYDARWTVNHTNLGSSHIIITAAAIEKLLFESGTATGRLRDLINSEAFYATQDHGLSMGIGEELSFILSRASIIDNEFWIGDDFYPLADPNILKTIWYSVLYQIGNAISTSCGQLTQSIYHPHVTVAFKASVCKIPVFETLKIYKLMAKDYNRVATAYNSGTGSNLPIMEGVE